MPAPHGKYDILAQAYRDEHGRSAARALRQIVVKKDGNVHCVPFSRGWQPDHLRRALRERQLEHTTLVEFYLDDDEGPESPGPRQVLTEIFGAFSAMGWGGLDSTSQLRELVLESGITTAYLRAICKVGFHYLLWALPAACTGRESEFAAIRSFIRDGTGDNRQFVRLVTTQFLPQLETGVGPTRPSHFLLARMSQPGIVAFVQFFVGSDDRPPPWSVRLSTAAHSEADATACHQLAYFEQRTEGFDGELIVVPEL